MRGSPLVAVPLAALLLLTDPGGGAVRADPGGTATAEQPTVVVEARTARSPLSPYLTGVNNNEWYDNSQGLWDAERDTYLADPAEKTARTGTNLIRYPGGTSANLFDWKKAIGPTEERGCQLSGKNGGSAPLDSVYGPDEHMEFLKGADADAIIMVASASESAADAADWVEYMNAPVGTNPRGGTAWAEVRAANGHPEPYGVRFWEIGNEIDRRAERYWLSQDNHEAVRQYTFGGTQVKVGEPAGRTCDHRDSAAVSNGKINQRFEAHYPPVVAKSQTVYVDGVAWTEVADLATAGADDTVYAFDPATGAIVFGDGTHGRVPPKSAVVTIDYTSGPHPGFVDLYAEMKKADPEIDVCSTWAPIRQTSGLDAISFPELMAQNGRAGDYDCVTIHPYTNFKDPLPGFGDDWETAREGHDEYFIGEQHATKLVDNLTAEVAEHNTSGAYVAVSEFGALWFNTVGVDISGYPSWDTSMTHVAYMGVQWTRFANRGMPFAVGNALTVRNRLRAVLGGAPDFVYTSEAVTRELMSPMLTAGGDVVANRVDDNPQVSADAAAPGFSYDALAVTAALGRDGKLRIMVVNTDPTQPVTANVVPAGFVHDGTVAVSTVAGESFESFNSVEHPDDIQIVSRTEQVRGVAFAHTFAPTSVTVLTLTAGS